MNKTSTQTNNQQWASREAVSACFFKYIYFLRPFSGEFCREACSWRRVLLVYRVSNFSAGIILAGGAPSNMATEELPNHCTVGIPTIVPLESRPLYRWNRNHCTVRVPTIVLLRYIRFIHIGHDISYSSAGLYRTSRPRAFGRVWRSSNGESQKHFRAPLPS